MRAVVRLRGTCNFMGMASVSFCFVPFRFVSPSRFVHGESPFRFAFRFTI